MSKNVYILLDRSGSMQALWDEAISSINSYVDKLSEVRVYLATFDSESYDVIRNLKSDSWKPINSKEVTPRGMTPLYDSTAKMVLEAMNDNPEKATLIVMTDGMENCSKKYNRSSCQDLLDSAEKKGWPVTFLGASFDKVDDVSKDLGRKLNRSVNFECGTMAAGFGALATKTMAYNSSPLRGSAALDTMNWTDEEKININKK